MKNGKKKRRYTRGAEMLFVPIGALEEGEEGGKES